MSLKYITQTEGLNNPINILKKKKMFEQEQNQFLIGLKTPNEELNKVVLLAILIYKILLKIEILFK